MDSMNAVRPADTEADLLALACDFERLQQQIDPLVAQFFKMAEGDPGLSAVGKAETDLVEQQDELAERAKGIPVTTMAGVRAKAVIARCLILRHYPNEDEISFYGEELGFAWDFINDILSLGAAATSVASAKGAPEEPIVALWAKTQVVNAELDRVSNQYQALHDRISIRRPGQPLGVTWIEWHQGDPDMARSEALYNRSNELCGHSSDLYDKIAVAVAVTPEGIKAKAAAALSIWVQEESLKEELWYYDLIANTLREAAAGSAV